MQINIIVYEAPKGSRRFSQTVSEDAWHHTDPSGRPFIAVVADGHGDEGELNVKTAELARFVANGLCDPNVLDVEALCELVQDHVCEAFQESKSGAVATRFMIDEGGIQIAYVGDVRCYRFAPDREDGFELLTEDHHPDHTGEYGRLSPMVYHPDRNPTTRFYFFPVDSPAPQRIMTSSGKQIRAIAVSRSFGDPDLRPAIISKPDVRLVVCDPAQSHMFALCSDGGAEIVEEVFKMALAQVAPLTLEDLRSYAVAHAPKNPRDDVTILFIECSP